MNCYIVEFKCTNYTKEAVSSDDNKQYLDVENGTLYVMAKDLSEVQEKLFAYKNKIQSCQKIGVGFTK